MVDQNLVNAGASPGYALASFSFRFADVQRDLDGSEPRQWTWTTPVTPLSLLHELGERIAGPQRKHHVSKPVGEGP